jgi:hypothetical protein
MRCFPAFTTRGTSFLGGEFVSFTLGVCRTSTFGGNFPLLGGVHRSKTALAGLRLLIGFGCHSYFSKDCFIGASHRAATDFNNEVRREKANGSRHSYCGCDAAIAVPANQLSVRSGQLYWVQWLARRPPHTGRVPRASGLKKLQGGLQIYLLPDCPETRAVARGCRKTLSFDGVLKKP